MTSDEQNLSIQVGTLIGELKGLNARLDRADVTRSELRADVHELKSDVHDLKTGQADMRRQIDTMKPITDMVKDWKRSVTIAVGFLVMVGSAIWWLGSTVWEWIAPHLPKIGG